MIFQTIIAAAAFSSIVAANDLFTLSAFIPGSPLHGQAVAAYGQSYYFGISTSSYCPSDVSSCPAGNETVFYPGLESLTVEVPGGEANYVTTDGRLGFTAPHSAETPPGSVTPYFGNWTYENTGPVVYTSSYDTPLYTYNNTQGSGSVLACPYNNSGTVFQQLYVKVAGFNRTDCSELAGLLPAPFVGDYGAWEYA
ncbi:putative secreted protein [Lachnellula arida]|uniref:Putative secreted protein n=1 Tax=Lachnellula arida TaxID=1316785 RepID=A0A8T9BGU3_9HELO|nr:putative secreted protein [Lachnellula arida]